MSLDLNVLETSFDLVAPRGDELMDVFYARLFAAVTTATGGVPRERRGMMCRVRSTRSAGM